MNEIEIGGGAQRILIGPTVDPADGVTPVAAITMAQDTKYLFAPNGDEYSMSAYTVSAATLTGYHWITVPAGRCTAGNLSASGNKGNTGFAAINAPTKYLPCKTPLRWKSQNTLRADRGTDRRQVDAREFGDSSLDLTSTMKTSVNAEVDTALNTAIPGDPTADSVNERVKTLDDNFTTTVAGRIDAAITSRSSHSAADVWSVATRALTDKAGFSLAADQSAVTIGTVNALASGERTLIGTAVWATTVRSLTVVTGFGLAADQSAVTIGTVNAVATGGISAASIAADAIGASELAASAATEIADALLARANWAYDGTTSVAKCLDRIMGYCMGKTVRASLVENFYATDGATLLFTSTYASGGRTVA